MYNEVEVETNMKILNLQSKTGVVMWSLILGVFVTIVLYSLSQRTSLRVIDGGGIWGPNSPQNMMIVTHDYGWPSPFNSYLLNYYNTYGATSVKDIVYQQILMNSFIVNLLFWVVVSLIILSLFRYFKNKKVLGKTI